MKLPHIQFYVRDWQSDSGLRSCSFAARGLWVEMMCIMAQGNPYGHLTLSNGQPISDDQLERLTGGVNGDVKGLLKELNDADVFSKNDVNVIYSRRMVKDWKRIDDARKMGKRGGNPALRNLQKPESRVHNPEPITQNPLRITGGVNPTLNPTLNHHDIQLFDSLWSDYGKYGKKPVALSYWKKLTQNQREAIQKALPKYMEVVEAGRKKKQFEGWINPANKEWEQDWNKALMEWSRTSATLKPKTTPRAKRIITRDAAIRHAVQALTEANGMGNQSDVSRCIKALHDKYRDMPCENGQTVVDEALEVWKFQTKAAAGIAREVGE